MSKAMKFHVYLLLVLLIVSECFGWQNNHATSRKKWMENLGRMGLSAIALAPPIAQAAPPIAVIAEELGYFPVYNRNGEMVYIPKKVSRASTDQAKQLAQYLQDKGVVMYGAYWCPHCARQKELFGKEAWASIKYVECSPKGYGFKGMCKAVDGYPTWKDKKGKEIVSGEASLDAIAKAVGFSSFDPSLEDEVPLVGSACRIR